MGIRIKIGIGIRSEEKGDFSVVICFCVRRRKGGVKDARYGVAR